MPSNNWNKRTVGRICHIDQPDILNVQLVSTNKQLDEIVPFKRLSTKDPMTAYLKHASPTTKMFFSDSIPSVLDHTVEQRFFFTYNKLQGATLDTLILGLNF